MSSPNRIELPEIDEAKKERESGPFDRSPAPAQSSRKVQPEDIEAKGSLDSPKKSDRVVNIANHN
jgi:hypothetical protein